MDKMFRNISRLLCFSNFFSHFCTKSLTPEEIKQIYVSYQVPEDGIGYEIFTDWLFSKTNILIRKSGF